jgi:hypothetical protein
MQSDSHAHDDHGGHDQTAASDEKLRSGLVFGWGLGMFVAVLVCIGFLTGYFWQKRDAHFAEVVGGRSTFGDTAANLDKVVQGRLTGYKKLGDGRYQIPVDEAMKKVVEEGL